MTLQTLQFSCVSVKNMMLGNGKILICHEEVDLLFVRLFVAIMGKHINPYTALLLRSCLCRVT